jgi:hypothetical protein
MSFTPGKKQTSLAQRRLPAPGAFSARGVDDSKASAIKPSVLVTPPSHMTRIHQKTEEAHSRHLKNQQAAKENASRANHLTRTKSASYGITSPLPKTQSMKRTHITKNFKSARETKSQELAAKLAYLKKLEEREKEDAAMLLLANALLNTHKDLLTREKQNALDMLSKLEPVLLKGISSNEAEAEEDKELCHGDRGRLSRREGAILSRPEPPVCELTGLTEPLIQQRRPFQAYDSDDEYYNDGTFWGKGITAMDINQRAPFIGGDPLSVRSSDYDYDDDDTIQTSNTSTSNYGIYKDRRHAPTAFVSELAAKDSVGRKENPPVGVAVVQPPPFLTNTGTGADTSTSSLPPPISAVSLPSALPVKSIVDDTARESAEEDKKGAGSVASAAAAALPRPPPVPDASTTAAASFQTLPPVAAPAPRGSIGGLSKLWSFGSDGGGGTGFNAADGFESDDVGDDEWDDDD